MRLLLTITILTIVLHTSAARCRRPRPSPVMGALQSILSPANAERTMQMLKVATQQTLGNTIGPCHPPLPPQIPIKYSPPILPEPCNCPLNLQIPNPNSVVFSNPIQTQLPVQMPIPFQTPSPIQVQMANPISYQVPSQVPIQLPSPPIQLPCPSQLPVQLPSVPIQLPSPPCQVPQLPGPLAIPEIVLERPCACEREIIFPSPEIPSYIYNSPVIPEVSAPIALTSAQDIYTCPIPSPAALFTLPATSPGSSCAQEVSSATRSQYLRKIPIPPPTL